MAATYSIADGLAALQGKRALLIGDLVLDTYVYGVTVRVSREAPVLVVRKQTDEVRLGGAANTANNLAELGLQVSVLSTLGNDAAGERLSGLLKDRGVNTDALLAWAQPTPTKTRIMAGALGTSKQQVLRLDEEPPSDPGPALYADLVDRLTELAKDADVVVVSDYGYGVMGAPTIAAVQALAKGGATVCVDSRYQFGAYKGVTAITPNLPEAEALLGRALDITQVDGAAGEVVERMNLEACLLTQGREGMTLCARGGDTSHVSIVGEDEVTDVSGAGDTVMATFAGAVAAGLGFVNAMRLANCAAGVVVSKQGAATASPDEILELAATSGLELLPWDVS